MAEKKASGKKAGETRYADSAETATADLPDSGRNVNANIRSAPADMARTEVTTPTALSYADEKGNAVLVRPVTTQEADGTETAEVQCPDGHAGGKGRAATGTIGKTATCGQCGRLLIPAEVVREGTGEAVTLSKKGDAVVARVSNPAKMIGGRVQTEDDRRAERESAPAKGKAKGDRTGRSRKAPAKGKKAAKGKKDTAEATT